jgi:hypothetical protein
MCSNDFMSEFLAVSRSLSGIGVVSAVLFVFIPWRKIRYAQSSSQWDVLGIPEEMRQTLLTNL